MSTASTARQDTADKLIEALEQDRFVLYFQEIKPLQRTREPAFREILIRFLDEEEMLQPPGSFIPVLESYSLMYTLDRWVISRVLSWLKQGAAKGGKDFPVRCSINLSAETIRNHQFPGFLTEQLDLFKVAPSSVCFEVVEADVAPHLKTIGNAVKRLKKAGCGFVLTGYNGDRISHDVVHKLAVDIVKIDGNIVRTMHTSENDLITVDAINRMCHAYGIRTVAELVEQAETIDKLKQLGVDYAQGFAVAKPEVLT
jgi:EAL domain-containing protein (putative c-di-GMP-specific phosphodiesterase class I)